MKQAKEILRLKTTNDKDTNFAYGISISTVDIIAGVYAVQFLLVDSTQDLVA